MTKSKEQFLVELKQIFIESSEDRLQSSYAHLENIANNVGDYEENLMVVRRDIHSLKGMGNASGFPGITTISHRAEEYLLQTDKVTVKEISELYKYFDAIQILLESDEQPNADQIAEIVRKLPYNEANITHKDGKEKNVTKRKTEALSVMPKSVHQRLISNELSNIGFRVSNITSSTEAIDLAIHTKPDCIITSAVIDAISGFELTKILRTIKNTKQIPVILVTSYDQKALKAENLPEDIRIAKKGEHFSKELEKCLKDLKLID